MRSSLREASAAQIAPVANEGREAKSVVAIELPINVRRFMRRIVLLQTQQGIVETTFNRRVIETSRFISYKQPEVDELYCAVGILTFGISIVPDQRASLLGSTENCPRK